MTQRGKARPDAPLPAARPQRRDAERNRQRILRAAAQVFTAHGLQASLDDVARQAEVGVGTVYRHFPGKESLAEALFAERVRELVTLAQHALDEQDSWAGLVSFLENAATLLAGDRGLSEIFMYGCYGRDRVSHARSQILPAVTRLVERAQRDGKLRPDLRPTDVPLIEFMLATAAGYAGHAHPGIWRRYLTLITDGMQPRRDGITALPDDALTPEELSASMQAGFPAGREHPRTADCERRPVQDLPPTSWIQPGGRRAPARPRTGSRPASQSLSGNSRDGERANGFSILM